MKLVSGAIEMHDGNGAELCQSVAKSNPTSAFLIIYFPQGRINPQQRSDQAMYKFLEGIVADCMTFPVKTVALSLTMRDLGVLFGTDDFNAYPVVENRQTVGLVTKFDFLNCFSFRPNQMIPRYEELMNRKVRDVMTSDYVYVSSTTRIVRVLQLMVDHHIRSIPVIDADPRLEGIISREDVMGSLSSNTCVPDHSI